MLLVFIRTKLHNVGYLRITEALDVLSCLRVPQLHLPVVLTGQELLAFVGESDVLDGFNVPVEGAQAVAVGVDVPGLKTSYMSAITWQPQRRPGPI
jgi:hypothetical protein